MKSGAQKLVLLLQAQAHKTAGKATGVTASPKAAESPSATRR
jgi:hypothetical protein